MESVVTDIEQRMGAARKARQQQDLPRAVDLLAGAYEASTSLDAVHSIRAIVGWRYLKGLFDLERIGEGEAVLIQLLELPEPFVSAGGGLRAAEPVARGIWDHLGYGRASVRRLWERYIDVFETAGDPWMAAAGGTQLLWDQACTGDLGAVRASLEAAACTTPKTFARGPSRHPQAADAQASLFYVWIDRGRIGSWAAVWAGDEELGRVALELYADGLAEAEKEEDYWFVEASARCEQAFGWPADASTRWRDAAAHLAHPRASLHRALAELVVSPAAAVSALAPQLAAADDAGPEWGVDVRLQLLDQAPNDPRAQRWRQEALDQVDRFGIHVFDRRG